MMNSLTTYRGVAHTWLCDHLGHLNTRNYVGMFDDSMQHFFHLLGYRATSSLGWADVKHVIEYRQEVPVGSLVHIDCSVIRIGNKSITYRQNLFLSDNGILCATNEATTVLLDLEARKALPLPDELREMAKKYMLDEKID